MPIDADMIQMPERVRIVEVGPRDGLQGVADFVPTQAKVDYILRLIDAGLRHIEVTSFVSPKAVPQMADGLDVVAQLPKLADLTYLALVPNYRGLEHALESGVNRIAVFAAASETFSERNINMNIKRSLDVFGDVVRDALAAGLSARAYLSTAFVCPYEGEVSKERVRDIAERLFELGVDEVAISDTIGAAAPRDIFETVGFCLKAIPAECLALHLHDTYGTAPANVLAGLQLGIRTFDTSAGGVGGCPFAPGAAGNLATEDLVYLLTRMGIATGVDLNKVVGAAHSLAEVLRRPLPSRNAARRSSRTR